MPKLFAASEPKRAPLNFKTTEGLRARLEASAAASGRALTHEAEHRVEQALDFDREFHGREAAEIYNNIGRFLRLFNVSAFSEETYLAREGLKSAFEKFVDDALPDGGKRGVGLLANSPAPEINPQRVERIKYMSAKIAEAVSTANLLDSFARLKEVHGEDAPRLGESMVDFMERVDISRFSDKSVKNRSKRSKNTSE